MSDKPAQGSDDPEFPDGKLNEEDEGSIQTGIGIEDGRVMIVWPKPITWVAFDPDAADDFADSIKMKAQMARQLTTD